MRSIRIDELEDMALAYEEALQSLLPLWIRTDSITGEYIETLSKDYNTISDEVLDFCLRLWSDAYDEEGEWDE